MDHLKGLNLSGRETWELSGSAGTPHQHSVSQSVSFCLHLSLCLSLALSLSLFLSLTLSQNSWFPPKNEQTHSSFFICLSQIKSTTAGSKPHLVLNEGLIKSNIQSETLQPVTQIPQVQRFKVCLQNKNLMNQIYTPRRHAAVSFCSNSDASSFETVNLSFIIL